MTRDDVIKLAREAGDDVEHTLPSDLDFLERFAAIVAATERTACARHFDVAMRNAVTAEREACAAICEHGWKTGMGEKYQGDVFATAIRARGGPCQDQ